MVCRDGVGNRAVVTVTSDDWRPSREFAVDVPARALPYIVFAFTP
jgi:hypothetical protein